MKQILASFLALSICLSLLSVPAVAQQSSSGQNRLFWGMRSHKGKLLAQAPDAREAEADQLLQQGIRQYKTGQFEAALQSGQQALTIYQELKERQGEGMTFGFIGKVYNGLGNFATAIEYLQKYLSIMRETRDRKLERDALNDLGQVYSNLENYTKSIEFYQQALTIARETQDSEVEKGILENLAGTYKSQGIKQFKIEKNVKVALQSWQQALAIYRTIGNRKEEGISLSLLGAGYNYLGQYQEGIKVLQQSLAIFRGIRNRQEEGSVLNELGNAYFFLEQYQQAIDSLEQSLAIDQETGDRSGQAYSLNNLGNAYLYQGQHQQAWDFYQQSLVIAREIRDRPLEAISLNNLGNTYFYLGQYQQAIKFFQQSLVIAREIRDHQGEAIGLNNLGDALLQSGKLIEAEQTLRTAIDVLEPLQQGLDDNQKISICDKCEQARAYRALQQVLIAQNKINDALEIAERGRARAFVELLAKQLFSNRKTQDASVLQRTITALSIQQIQQIAKQQNATLVEYSIINERFGVPETKQIKESELFIWVIQPTGAVSFRQVDLKPLWQQQETSETKAASRNSWRSHLALWGYPVMIIILIVVVGSCIGLAVWRGRLAKTSSTSRRQLAPRLLLFVVAACSTVGLVWLANQNLLSRDFATRSEQQPKTALAELIFSTHESSEKGIRGLAEIASGKTHQSPKERLQQLHQLLIQPIADLLPTDLNSSVIFIPQGNLFFVPFPALQDANGKHLIEKHTILTAPSIQVLELTHQRRQELAARQNKPLQSQDVLVVGNPTMPKVASVPGEPPEQLKSLPGAEREAKEIAKRLNTRAIIGKQATKAAIVQQMPKARLIHLATHGLLDDLYNGDIPGAIALAPSGKDDGLLRASEILKLKLNANLIVLSACNTGQGRITGDGVIGLSRSLFTAGVPSVIVSLWAVPDAPTAFLMTNFYKNLEQNPDKAHALRQAMLTTLKKYPNPREWAAFTLIGEAE